MNILTDPAPKTVNITGVEVPINWDFRASIRFEMLMEEDMPDAEKARRALEIYYPTIPSNLQEAVDKLLWFYAAGKEADNAVTSPRRATRIYSYSYDDEYIYSAFLGQYGVDLQDIPSLHWWKFRAMFAGLQADTKIVEIMGYRAMEIPAKMSREQKDFYRKMKKQYALPLPKSEREKLNAIEEALINGGDVSGLL